MKRYIKSSYTYDPWKNADMHKWSAQDIEIWNSTDWKARNYDSLYVYEDSFEGTLLIYGVPGGTIRESVTFVKEIRPNTLYAPIYTIPDWYDSDIYRKYKRKGLTILSPMCDGRTHVSEGVTYKVADRAETDQLYDMLTR